MKEQTNVNETPTKAEQLIQLTPAMEAELKILFLRLNKVISRLTKLFTSPRNIKISVSEEQYKGVIEKYFPIPEDKKLGLVYAGIPIELKSRIPASYMEASVSGIFVEAFQFVNNAMVETSFRAYSRMLFINKKIKPKEGEPISRILDDEPETPPIPTTEIKEGVADEKA